MNIMNITKLIKTEDLLIHILEERLNIINTEIERIDNILDKYGDYREYKKLKIKTLYNKFNNLLNDQSSMKSELRQRRVYKFKLQEHMNQL